MSEVWIFRGAQPVLWRIPVSVAIERRTEACPGRHRTRRELAYFEPAVPLLGIQRVALSDFFSTQKMMERKDGRWRLRRNYRDLEKALKALGGVRATSDDPEDHLVWGARRPPMDLKGEQRERLEWLSELHAGGVGESVAQLAYFWRAFRLHIANTLLNREQPVDFHWFKLHNCPLRTGWHESTDLDYRKPPKEPKNILRRVMGDDRMLAFDVEGEHCLRHIEVEHADEWWELVRHVEGRRRYKLGHENYARTYQKSLERFALTAWRLHCGWFKEMAQDGLVRVAYGRGGGFRFMWDPLARGVRRPPYKRGKVPFRGNLRHLRDAIVRVRKTLPRAHGRVPEVSDLRPAEETVRQSEDQGSRPTVDQPGDGPRGSDGVLVSTDAQKLVPAGAVLAPRAGLERDGLASGT